MELARVFNLSPFDVLHQDKDDVILLINYYNEKDPEPKQKPAAKEDSERILVNDLTATGGWW